MVKIVKKSKDNLAACLKYGYVNSFKFMKKYILKGEKMALVKKIGEKEAQKRKQAKLKKRSKKWQK